MLSLYFHIPFCEKKCNYCSFYIVPQNQTGKEFLQSMKNDYLVSLKNEIDFQKEKFGLGKEKIYTIYFGGGTPSEFGLERTFELLNYVKEKFDTSSLKEFSFELNPILNNDVEGFENDTKGYHKESLNNHSESLINHTLSFMERLNNFVLEKFGIPARFSIGIQSLDDNLLEKSGRNYTFKQIEELLGRMTDDIEEDKGLSDNFKGLLENNEIEKDEGMIWKDKNKFKQNLSKSFLNHSTSKNNHQTIIGEIFGCPNKSPKSPLIPTSPIINLDFISFGIETDLDKNYFQRFHNFVEKYFDMIDSYSIYTLELFDGSIWKDTYQTNEDKILDNFQSYLDVLQGFEYERYEISNFAKKGKESKHNQVYWEMKPYLGFGTSASGLIKLKIKNSKKLNSSKFSVLNSQFSYIRYTNSYGIQNYLKGQYDYSEYKELSEKEFLQEKIFLTLRTNKGLELTDNVKPLLDMNKINEFIKDNYLKINNNVLYMTYKGFNLYNYILTDILDI